jgi:hypothetical protein
MLIAVDEYKRGDALVLAGQAPSGRELSAKQKKRNRKQSLIRLRVEHVF